MGQREREGGREGATYVSPGALFKIDRVMPIYVYPFLKGSRFFQRSALLCA
jgi:hypothetical protein